MDRLQKIPPRIVGLGFLAVLSLITLVAFAGLHKIPFKPDTRKVVAMFDSAPQLYSGDDVRLEGDIDGTVAKVEPVQDGRFTRVTMDVETAAGQVYADAKARTRIKTLLGGSFYVQLERGTKSAGPLGDKVIPVQDTNVQVEVDDVLNIFREQALTGFKTIPGEVATALTAPAPLAASIETVNTAADDVTRTLDAVRGQDKGTDLPRLVQATATTVRALDSQNANVERLVAGAAATLRTTGNRQQEIRDVIGAAPSVTFDMTNTLARLDRTLDVADGLVNRLRPAAPDVAPTLTELQPALNNTDTLLETTRPLLRQAIPLLTNLGAAADGANPLIEAVRPGLANLDETILPYFARKDPETGKSTTVMIGGTAAGFGGAANQLDENGHFIRFPASVGSNNLYLPCKSNLIDGSASSQLACDDFNTVLTEYLNYLPELGGNQVPGGTK